MTPEDTTSVVAISSNKLLSPFVVGSPPVPPAISASSVGVEEFSYIFSSCPFVALIIWSNSG